MKKVKIIILLMLGLNISLQAQSTTESKTENAIIFKKGTKFIGTNGLGFGIGKNSFGAHTTSMYGQFLSKRLVIGSKLNLGFSSSDYTNNYYVELTPFAKYYFSNLERRLVFYTSVQFNVNQNITALKTSNYELQSTNYSALIPSVGAEYFFNERFSLFGSVDYRLNISEISRPNYVHSQFGLKYYLGRSRKKQNK